MAGQVQRQRQYPAAGRLVRPVEQSAFSLGWHLLRRSDCQSGVWRKLQEINSPVIRYSSWELNYSTASCAEDEIVIGGGGECADPDRAWVHLSRPDASGTRWVVDCYGRSQSQWHIHQDVGSRAFAVCLKKQ